MGQSEIFGDGGGHLTSSAVIHGGRLIAARQRFPEAPEPFIDLSTGINPRPYLCGPIPQGCLSRLPEPEEEQALIEAAADCYGVVTPVMVVASPGTQALISLLPRLFAGRKVGVLMPCYGEHLAAWGGAAVPVHLFDALADYDVAVLCNPNNPDGRVVPATALLALADRLAARDGFVLVDEAYVDFLPAVSLARHLPHPGLVLLRSFGKTFGLAGLRLGFALTDARRAALLRRSLGPWPVSGPALWAGRQALADSAWIAEAASQCRAAAARLDALLGSAGLSVIGGTALFRLAHSAGAPQLYERLCGAGILVRAFAANPTWLRFGLPGTEAAWQRLQAALAGPPVSGQAL